MRTKILIIGLALVVVLSVSLMAKIERETRNIGSEGAKSLDVKLEFGAGDITVTGDDISDAALLEFEYNPARVEYLVDYAVSGDRGHLSIESDHHSKNDIDTDENKLHMVMSTRYPTRLEMDMGACDARLDLGGVPLEELNIDVGAASGEIDFSKPNKQRLREINIDAGATSLDMTMIGNANFDEMNFSGGVGSFDLDFRGEYKGDSRIDIEIGLGSADITLPAGVPVRIVAQDANWLSSLDIHEEGDVRKVRDDEWKSADYDNADTRITIYLEVGLGSVDVRFR